MNEKLSCPECDSTNIKTEEIPETTKIPFGATVIYNKVVHICGDCGEKGSFSSQLVEENHENYYSSLKESNKLSVENICQYLSNHGNSMAHIERSLGLAQRTISRWKTQGVAASGMALMRIIRTYPWILNVADENFDERFANQELIRQAGEVFFKFHPPSNYNISKSEESLECRFTWHKEGSETEAPSIEAKSFTTSSQPLPSNTK